MSTCGSGNYPRESTELVLFGDVTVNGVATTSFTYQLQRESERPAMSPGSWLTPVNSGGQLGFMLQPVARRDTYRVWVKIAQAGQEIVELAGEVVRT